MTLLAEGGGRGGRYVHDVPFKAWGRERLPQRITAHISPAEVIHWSWRVSGRGLCGKVGAMMDSTMTDQYQAAYPVGLRRPVGSISAASSDEREVLIVVVAVQQERSAGGRNAAGRYGWIINLCKHPITSTG
jgi:hypothetical protein